jgi:two-component system, NarL family, nitrate/nitrite response regulator NarL
VSAAAAHISPEQAACVSVLLVTPIRLYADGIADALSALATIAGVTVVPSIDAAAGEQEREPRDVVVLDLAGIDDVAAAQAFVNAAAPAPVVALAVREHDQEVIAWAERGAMGIVTRRAGLDDLRHAVEAAARGEFGCSSWVATALLRRVAEAGAERRRRAPHPELTSREREIGALLVEGLSNKEIAGRLLLGVSTVKNHVHNLLAKIDARTRAEAVAVLMAAQDPGRPGAGSGSRPQI